IADEKISLTGQAGRVGIANLRSHRGPGPLMRAYQYLGPARVGSDMRFGQGYRWRAGVTYPNGIGFTDRPDRADFDHTELAKLAEFRFLLRTCVCPRRDNHNL